MGFIGKAFKKAARAVKKVAGGILGTDDDSIAPEVTVEQPAPAVDQPLQAVEAVELGSDESNLKRKKRGKSSLKIDRGGSNVSSSSKGINIV